MSVISANGIDIAYELTGSGPLAMFIGGIDMDIGVWNRFYTAPFLQNGYRVLVVNPRGMPPSSVTEPPYTVDMLVNDCQAVLDALDVDECCVIGASLGAMVAQELVLRRPADKLGLALIAATVRQSAWVKMVSYAELALLELPATRPADYMLAFDLLQLFTVNELCNDDLVRKAAARLKTKDRTDNGYRGLLHAAASYDGCLDRLPGLNVPTVFVSFAEDVLSPAQPVKQAAATMPASRYVQIDGSGHSGIYAKSAPVAAAILQYFDETVRRTRVA